MKFGLNNYDADFAVNLCNNYKNIIEKEDRSAKEELQFFIGKQLRFCCVRTRRKKESEFFDMVYVKGISIEEYSNEFAMPPIEIYRSRVRIYEIINEICSATLDYFYDDSCKSQVCQLKKDVKKKIYLAWCEYFIQKQDYLWSTEGGVYAGERNGDLYYRDLVNKIKEVGIEDLIFNHSELLNKYKIRDTLYVDKFLAEFLPEKK